MAKRGRKPRTEPFTQTTVLLPDKLLGEIAIELKYMDVKSRSEFLSAAASKYIAARRKMRALALGD